MEVGKERRLSVSQRQWALSLSLALSNAYVAFERVREPRQARRHYERAKGNL